MKRAFVFDVFLMSLLSMILTCLLACQSTVKTTHVAIVTVDSAMSAWSDYVKAGLATPEQVEKVHVAYDRYYASITSAKTATLAYKANGDTNALNKALSAILAAEPEVLRLIFDFLPIDKSSKLKGLL